MSKVDEARAALEFLLEPASRIEGMAKELLALSREVSELKLLITDEVSRVEVNVDGIIRKKLDKTNVTKAAIIAYMKDHNMLEGE